MATRADLVKEIGFKLLVLESQVTQAKAALLNGTVPELVDRLGALSMGSEVTSKVARKLLLQDLEREGG